MLYVYLVENVSRSCTILDEPFNGDSVPSTVTVVSGSWSVASGSISTSDSGAVWRTTNTMGTTHHVTLTFQAGNSGDVLDLRFGWDTTNGDYLFARVEVGTSCGKLSIGHYDGSSETILEGPYHIAGVTTGTDQSLVVCWDGDWAVATLGGTTIEAETGIDFIDPAGEYVGVATQNAGSYDVSQLTIDYIIDNDYNICHTCAPCPDYTDTFSSLSCVWTNDGNWSVSNGDASSSTSNSLLLLEKYYKRARVRRFKVDFTTEHQDDEFRFYFFYVDSNNHAYVEYIRDTGFTIHEVSGGVDTTKATANNVYFDLEYTLTICLSDEDVYVDIGGVTTSSDSIAQPAASQVGLGTGSITTGVDVKQIVEDCDCSVPCTACSDGYGPDEFDVVVNAGPAAGTYRVKRTFSVSSTCYWEIGDYSNPGGAVGSAQLAISLGAIAFQVWYAAGSYEYFLNTYFSQNHDCTGFDSEPIYGSWPTTATAYVTAIEDI